MPWSCYYTAEKIPSLSSPAWTRYGRVDTEKAGGPIQTINAVPTAGGFGYSPGDLLTVGNGISGTVRVNTVDGGGGVLTLFTTPVSVGSYYTVSIGNGTTGGGGGGCQIEITAIDTTATYLHIWSTSCIGGLWGNYYKRNEPTANFNTGFILEANLQLDNIGAVASGVMLKAYGAGTKYFNLFIERSALGVNTLRLVGASTATDTTTNVLNFHTYRLEAFTNIVKLYLDGSGTALLQVNCGAGSSFYNVGFGAESDIGVIGADNCDSVWDYVAYDLAPPIPEEESGWTSGTDWFILEEESGFTDGSDWFILAEDHAGFTDGSDWFILEEGYNVSINDKGSVGVCRISSFKVSWTFPDPLSAQTGYEVQVSLVPNFATSVYASGLVPSTNLYHNVPSGVLTLYTKYYVRIRLWETGGIALPWSTPSQLIYSADGSSESILPTFYSVMMKLLPSVYNKDDRVFPHCSTALKSYITISQSTPGFNNTQFYIKVNGVRTKAQVHRLSNMVKGALDTKDVIQCVIANDVVIDLDDTLTIGTTTYYRNRDYKLIFDTTNNVWCVDWNVTNGLEPIPSTVYVIGFEVYTDFSVTTGDGVALYKAPNGNFSNLNSSEGLISFTGAVAGNNTIIAEVDDPFTYTFKAYNVSMFMSAYGQQFEIDSIKRDKIEEGEHLLKLIGANLYNCNYALSLKYQRYCQTFKPIRARDTFEVVLQMGRTFNPGGNVYVSIYDCDANGEPLPFISTTVGVNKIAMSMDRIPVVDINEFGMPVGSGGEVRFIFNDYKEIADADTEYVIAVEWDTPSSDNIEDVFVFYSPKDFYTDGHMYRNRIDVANPTPGVWESSSGIVDNYGSVGQNTCTAIDSYNHIYTSYIDSTNNNLKCTMGLGSSWKITTVDDTGTIGAITGIAIDPQTDYPVISYYDNTNGNLMCGIWDGSSWDLQIIDSTGNVGLYNSVVVDSKSNIHIGYYDSTNTDLKYAFYELSVIKTISLTPTAGGLGYNIGDTLTVVGGTTPGTVTVTSVGVLNEVLTLDTTPATGGSGYSLGSAQATTGGAGSGCTIEITELDRWPWVLTTVDSVNNVGMYNSIAVDSSDNPSISYLDYTNWNLKYVSFSGGVWGAPVVVDGATPVVSVGAYTSLDIDTFTVSGITYNYPMISYYDATNGWLKVARWNGSVFILDIVDDIAPPTGLYTSLKVDNNNRIYVSYYDSGGGQNLKYALFISSIATIGSTPTAGGSGYAPGDVITVVQTGASGGTVTVATVDGSGKVLTLNTTPVSAGTGYSIGAGKSTSGGTGNGCTIEILTLSYTWTLSTLDTVGNVGQYTSIALDSNGYPYIAYYDATNFCLKFIRKNALGWGSYADYSTKDLYFLIYGLVDPTWIDPISTYLSSDATVGWLNSSKAEYDLNWESYLGFQIPMFDEADLLPDNLPVIAPIAFLNKVFEAYRLSGSYYSVEEAVKAMAEDIVTLTEDWRDIKTAWLGSNPSGNAGTYQDRGGTTPVVLISELPKPTLTTNIYHYFVSYRNAGQWTAFDSTKAVTVDYSSYPATTIYTVDIRWTTLSAVTVEDIVVYRSSNTDKTVRTSYQPIANIPGWITGPNANYQNYTDRGDTPVGAAPSATGHSGGAITNVRLSDGVYHYFIAYQDIMSGIWQGLATALSYGDTVTVNRKFSPIHMFNILIRWDIKVGNETSIRKIRVYRAHGLSTDLTNQLNWGLMDEFNAWWTDNKIYYAYEDDGQLLPNFEYNPGSFTITRYFRNFTEGNIFLGRKYMAENNFFRTWIETQSKYNTKIAPTAVYVDEYDTDVLFLVNVTKFAGKIPFVYKNKVQII